MKWEVAIYKKGLEINITNGEYTFFLGDAYSVYSKGEIVPDIMKQAKLMTHAQLFCDKLNEGEN